MDAEQFALSLAFDMVRSIKVSFKSLLDREFPLRLNTASKSLFDSSSEINPPSEKRFLIDLEVIRQSYEIEEIEKIVWIPTEANPADLLTN